MLRSRWKKFQIGASLSLGMVLLLIGFTPTAFATSFTTESGVNSYRIWTVLFNQTVNNSTLVPNITVAPAGSSQNASVEIIAGNDNRSALIYPPAEGYTAGQTYTITVGTGVKSSLGANCPLSTKNFSIANAPNTTGSNYTTSQLENFGITCSEASSTAGTNITLFTPDYSGIFTVGQTSASVNNNSVILASADAPLSSGGTIQVTSNLLWQCFGIRVGSNNIVQEAVKVTTACPYAYIKTGTVSVLMKPNDRILPGADTEICNGTSPVTLSLNDGTRFILDSGAKIKLLTSNRNANGSKTVLMELTSGRLTVAAVKPASNDSFRIKVGGDYLSVTDSATFSVTK